MCAIPCNTATFHITAFPNTAFPNTAFHNTGSYQGRFSRGRRASSGETHKTLALAFRAVIASLGEPVH